MKIIKKGRKPSTTKRFTCDKCGCVFEADESEYYAADSIAYLHDNIEFTSLCPCCRQMVYIKK